MTNHPGGLGNKAETVSMEQLQQNCFRSFIGCLNWHLKNNQKTEKLVINYQGTDCRITECNEDGTCMIDVPGGERMPVALSSQDCARLQCAMCDVPFSEMVAHVGGNGAGGMKG